MRCENKRQLTFSADPMTELQNEEVVLVSAAKIKIHYDFWFFYVEK